VRQRGGWLPGTLWFLGAFVVGSALLSLAGRGFSQGMLDIGIYSVDWPVSTAALVLGSFLIWLSRR